MIGDDTQANAVGFALDLKNNPKTLDELTRNIYQISHNF